MALTVRKTPGTPAPQYPHPGLNNRALTVRNTPGTPAPQYPRPGLNNMALTVRNTPGTPAPQQATIVQPRYMPHHGRALVTPPHLVPPPTGSSYVSHVSSQHSSNFSPHRHPAFDHFTTPSRSTYLEHISPLRFPNMNQDTPTRRKSIQQLSAYERDHLTPFSPGSNARAGQDVMATPAPVMAQLATNRRNAVGGQVQPPSDDGTLRRMPSVPALMPTRAQVPFDPDAVQQVAPAPAPRPIAPVRDDIDQFLHVVKSMILHAVQINQYKNGLFCSSITPHTDILKDLDNMMTHAQGGGLDACRLANVRYAVADIKGKKARGESGINIMGVKITVFDLYYNMLTELRDVLWQTDLKERANWENHYGRNKVQN